jgi:hypothetical protein
MNRKSVDCAWCRRGLIVVVGVFCCVDALSQEVGKPPREDSGTPASRKDPTEPLIRDQTEATERACKAIGFARTADITAEASVVHDADDNTPFLSERISKSSVWRVELRGWKLQFAGLHPDAPHAYNPNWEILLDPNTSQILRIASGPPLGEPPIPPEPDAKSATEQLQTTNDERYHGFPEEPPTITFVDAIRVLAQEGENPLAARQIKAQYVEWSEAGRDRRPVWAITLRGIRFEMAERRGGPQAPIYTIRHIIDARTGKWLGATNTPAPTKEK